MKAKQRLYFLRKLKSFGVNSHILIMFYRAIVESVLTQAIIVWFDRATVTDLRKLASVVRSAERIIGINLSPLCVLYEQRMDRRTKMIMEDIHHPANNYFEFLPHGIRLRTFKGNKRFVNSFYPSAVKHFNSKT